MYGAIVGDIIGSTYEISGEKPLKPELFTDGSSFTDDTILTVATAESLLINTAFETSYRKFYKMFTKPGCNWPGGMDYGYGPNFVEWAESADVEKASFRSAGNGSAMRVSPIGWRYNEIEKAILAAENSAKVTHNHSESIKGAKAVAIAILLARMKVEPTDIRLSLINGFGYDMYYTLDYLHEHYYLDTTCAGSLPEALFCLFESSSYEGVMHNCIYIGGDTDTICAMAGSIAEALWGVPEHLKSKAAKMLNDHAPYLKTTIDAFEKSYGPAIAQEPSIKDQNDAVKHMRKMIRGEISY